MVPEGSSLAAHTNESTGFTVRCGDSVGERRSTVFGACSFSRTRQGDGVRSVRLHSNDRHVEERRRSTVSGDSKNGGSNDAPADLDVNGAREVSTRGHNGARPSSAAPDGATP